MASKNKKKKKSETVDLQDQAPMVEPISRLPATPPASSSPQATLLTLTGLGVALFGCALSLGPTISWKAAKVMEGLAGLGVHGGVLFVGGLMLVGLAMLRRGQVSLADIGNTAADAGLIEDMASDIVRMVNAFDQLQHGMDVINDELAEMKTAVENPPVPPPAPAPVQESNGSEDAIFRMAASLDKVGAKIEERLKSQFTELQTRIASVESSMAKAEQSVSRLAEQGVAAGPHAAPVELELGLGQEQPSIEAELDASPLSMPEGLAAPVEPAEAAAADGSLGVLDDLHDPVDAPLPAQPEVNFDQADALRLSDVQPPELGDTWEEGPSGPNPDANLRSALEDMRRTGEQPPQ